MRNPIIIIAVLLLMHPVLTGADPDETSAEPLEEPIIGVTRSIPPAELAPMPPATCPQPIYREPIVARVTIPAQTRGGYFVARHEAYVVLKTGCDHGVHSPNLTERDAAPGADICPVGKGR